ncbi:hypothetical protein C4K18_2500 [Pseudomonas chlororaphis subsp. aurantiaca]|nr:hypothetical protein C4K18_2500 [Pseudomonas chlororaphis subsp. aurantiaca]
MGFLQAFLGFFQAQVQGAIDVEMDLSQRCGFCPSPALHQPSIVRALMTRPPL